MLCHLVKPVLSQNQRLCHKRVESEFPSALTLSQHALARCEGMEVCCSDLPSRKNLPLSCKDPASQGPAASVLRPHSSQVAPSQELSMAGARAWPFPLDAGLL